MELKNLFQNFVEAQPEFIKEFREKSFDDFEILNSENSEIFKNDTHFNNFDFDINPNGNQNNIELNKNSDVVVCEIQEMIDKFPSEFRRFLTMSDDKFLNLNNALFNSGFYIYVPKNIQVEQPIVIKRDVNENTFSKLIILVDSNSSVNILEENNSSDQPLICSDSTEIILRDNSKLNFSSIQNFGRGTTHFSNRNARCQKDSQMFWNIGLFGGERTRSRIANNLQGVGSSCDNIELVFSDGSQKIDMFSSLLHFGNNTTGKIMSKGIHKDKSSAIFKGMIRIESVAKNANSFLAQHAMLLSKEANAKAIPGLEIENNDVKATHAASVSQIDEEKIFYLMSRGLDEDTAKKLVVFGFFDPLITRIPDDAVREKILNILDQKWAGKSLDYESVEKNSDFADTFEGHYKYR